MIAPITLRAARTNGVSRACLPTRPNKITLKKKKNTKKKEIDGYLPRWSVSPKKISLIRAAIKIPTGLNMATNTGPFLRKHHATRPNNIKPPKIAFGTNWQGGKKLSKLYLFFDLIRKWNLIIVYMLTVYMTVMSSIPGLILQASGFLSAINATIAHCMVPNKI